MLLERGVHAPASTVMVLASVLPLTLAFTVGCYGTRQAPATAASGLKNSGQSRELVVRHGPFGVHVGPRSWVRFCLRDGSRTPWFNAGKLRVNDVMVVTAHGQARPLANAPAVEALRWDDIASVEVNDLDLVETIAGLTAGTGLVILAVTAETLLVGGLSAISGGHFQPSDLGIIRGAVDFVAGEALKRPEEDPGISTDGVTPASPTPAPPACNSDSAVPCVQDDARPLFASRAWRRDLVLFTLASEAGLDAGAIPLSVAAVAVGLRLRNVFEVGFGARSWFGAPVDGEAPRPVSVPFLRFGLHLDLDAARRVALTIGADLGGNLHDTHARFSFGVRLRLTDNLQLGLYPWNPTGLTHSPSEGAQEHSTSHLHLVELSWLL